MNGGDLEKLMERLGSEKPRRFGVSGPIYHNRDGSEAIEAIAYLRGALREECRKRLDAEIALNRLQKVMRGESDDATPALAEADKVLEAINDEGALVDKILSDLLAFDLMAKWTVDRQGDFPAAIQAARQWLDNLRRPDA